MFSLPAQKTLKRVIQQAVREVLGLNRNYYVSTLGSDNNNGKTPATPFLTIQKAINTAVALDSSIYDVTIIVADGTYTTGNVTLKSFIGSGTYKITGNSATPANCVINVTNAHCFLAVNVTGAWWIDGFKLQTTTAGSGMFLIGPPVNVTLFNIDFGACATSHVRLWYGAQIGMASNYTVSGNSPTHWDLNNGSFINCQNITVTISGAPTITTWLKMTDRAGALIASNTYSGAPAAGTKKFDIQSGAVAISGVTLPGTVAGTTATGGSIDGVGNGFIGRTDASSPPAGYLGEFTSGSVASGVALVTATAKDVTTVSLTAGEWDVQGVIEFTSASMTSSATAQASISQTANTLGALGTIGGTPLVVNTTSLVWQVVTPTVRVSLSATTTLRLVGKMTFSAGSVSCGGLIRARRVS